MKMSKLRVFVLTILALLFVPILITQLTKHEGRHYLGVALKDTEYTEIDFRNTRQNIGLGGMLFVPSGTGPFPAAVVIHGSGTSTRNNRWYVTLAHHLQQNGVVVLLPDKRGSEKSQGNWQTADFEDLATDTLAAIRFLQDQGNVAISQIGVVGMSQGGWIAPIVANKSSDVAFIVNLVGSTVTPKEQLLYEENHNLREEGVLPGFSNLIAIMSTAYIRNIAQKQFWDAVGDYDPLPLWKQIAVDTLVLYGRDDTNVPSAESASRLRALENPRITVRIYEGSGHALADPVDVGDQIMRADALESISDFIRAAGSAD